MKSSFKILSHDQPELRSDLPPGFTGVRLPGGTVVSAEGDFGSLCIQDYRGKHYCMRYTVLGIMERLILQSAEKQTGLFTRILLKNAIKQEVAGTGEILLREGQFSVLQGMKPQITMFFEKPQSCIHFDAYFSPGMVKELLPMFPKMEELFNTGGPVVTKPKRAEGPTRELINTILHCRYEDEQRRYFFESRVKDLLFQLLVQLSEKEPDSGQPTERELDAVYMAEKMISGDLTKHFPIRELARKIHINEFRFKELFKKIFGTGVHEYRQIKRLEKAKELLESGMPVKVVAAETGYRLTHFITTFQEHYGFTPGSIKRNMR